MSLVSFVVQKRFTTKDTEDTKERVFDFWCHFPQPLQLHFPENGAPTEWTYSRLSISGSCSVVAFFPYLQQQ